MRKPKVTTAGVLNEADTVGGGVTRSTVPVTQSANVMDSEIILEIGLRGEEKMRLFSN